MLTKHEMCALAFSTAFFVL